MIQTYNVDDLAQREVLLERTPDVGALARRSVYGRSPWAIPVGEALADKLVDPKDYKEVIQHCHDQQIFPLYHQHATWAPEGQMQWDQNGLGFCWAWGATAGLMDLLAREGKPVPLLSPVSLGWLVNWRNQGNYLESAIKGLKERGVCEMKYTPDPHSLSYRNYEEGWETNWLGYRLGEVFDTDGSSKKTIIQHTVTLLSRGISCPNAFTWWGHALEVVAVWWDESVKNNIRWGIRNSHKESDIIEMTGDNAVSDEVWGYSASQTAV